MKQVLSVALLFVSVLLMAEGPLSMTKMQKVMDFHTLVSWFDQYYGPQEFKKSQIITEDYTQMVKNFYMDISRTANDADYYAQVLKFLSKFRDGHVSFGNQIYSQDAAYLMVDFDYIDDKVLVVKTYNGAPATINVGDELVSFDGVSASQYLSDLDEHYIHGGTDNFNKASQAYVLAFRKANIMMPTGTHASVTLKNYMTGNEYNESMEWVKTTYTDIYSGLSEGQKSFLDEHFSGKGMKRGRNPQSFDMMFKNSLLSGKVAQGPMLEDKMTAEVYTVSQGPINYSVGRIRIPDYDSNFSYQTFASYLTQMASVDGLIIDERDNPGGVVIYCFAVARHLAGKTIKNVKFSVPVNRDWLYYFEQEYIQRTKQSQYYTEEEIETAKECRDTVFADAAAGQKMSDYVPFLCYDDLAAYTPTYSGPILILTSQTCFSCGDILPFIIKHNDFEGRIKIFGETTGGGGGTVGSYTRLPYSSMSIGLTES